MGYIKKLKNNELVGGTDKTTIYPVTSAEAVFEEVSDNEFKSQKYLNNHITNERIVDNTIENDKLKDDTIDMGKLNTQLKTIIQNAYDASWKVKEEPFSLETKYDANDVVYDPATNSSYVSLTADNQGNPVNPEDEGYVEGKWRIIINGISAVESTEVINETVGILENKFDTLEGNVDEAIEGLDNRIDEIQDDLSSLTAYETAVTPSYDTQIPLKNLASTAQVGYYFCTVEGSETVKQVSNAIVSNTAVSQIGAFSLPPSGGQFKVKMSNAHTATSGSVTLRFGSVAATNKPLYYNGEPVSATNSWDADEVISVYFDGTNYQASNAQGGGGKAEKIKYDNSQSGLAAENVQDALDEAKENINEVNARFGGNNKNYDNNVCTITGILKSSDGTVDTSANTYKTSDYIRIPDGTIKLVYSGVSQYRLSKWCGIVVTNAEKEVLFYNNQTTNAAQSGEILLSSYPTAAYFRFCPYASTSASVTVVAPNGLIEDIEELETEIDGRLDSIEDCCGFVGISEDETVYGSYDTTIVNPSAWSGTTDIATWKDDAVGSNGLIDKIYVLPMAAGKVKIAVGTLDQRGWMLSRYTFEVDVTTGWNIVDVTDKRYNIQSGEQLFVYVKYGAKVGWKTTSSGKHLLYGVEDYELSDSKTYRMGFAYSITTIDSIFALQEENKALAQSVENLASQLAGLGKLIDNNGDAYKLKVVNGELILSSLQYENVVAIGNSMTANGVQTSVGWYGGNYAMAATSEPLGWTARLQTILRQKRNNAVVNKINVAAWERSYGSYTDSQLATLLSSITSSTDCIIYRAGENASVKASTQNAYYNGLKRLINKARELAPTADIYICGTMWVNNYADAAHIKLASEIGASYVTITSDVYENAEWLADYTWGNGTYAGNMYPIKNGAVAKHMGDVAYFYFANTFADILGYDKLTDIHNININSSVPYFINKVVGVSDGLISIHTYGETAPTITVTSGGNSIETTVHDMSSVTIKTYNKQFVMPTFVTTFEMPNGDVAVSISQ